MEITIESQKTHTVDAEYITHKPGKYFSLSEGKEVRRVIFISIHYNDGDIRCNSNVTDHLILRFSSDGNFTRAYTDDQFIHDYRNMLFSKTKDKVTATW